MNIINATLADVVMYLRGGLQIRVVAFFQTEEGRREYEEWKAKRDAEKEKKSVKEIKTA